MQRSQENRTAGCNEQCEGVDRAQARSLEADGSRPVAARSVEVRGYGFAYACWMRLSRWADMQSGTLFGWFHFMQFPGTWRRA